MSDESQDQPNRPSKGDGAPPGSDGSAPEPNEAPPANGEAISPDMAKLALRKVKDPELGLNIIDLGLVYEIVVDASNNIHVDMTLTSPGCPAGPQIMTDVERALQALPGVGDVELNLVWSPYWTPERIEPRVRAYMGL
ncbi:MAG TPA: metal-sulfur cluster assembly factor [Gemmatimonadaceae bacterium]|jgi:metal-sulfur cluster biosynthetic enzyme